MKLQGLTAVITGASRGFGYVLAKAFWQEGANLVLIARSQSGLESLVNELPVSNPSQTKTALSCDLSDSGAVNQITQFLGSSAVDILVNNAAIQGPIGQLIENDWSEWEITLRVNLLVPVALCRALLPLMVKQGKGKIINLSGGGAATPRTNFSAYGTAKAGLVRFSETLAEEVKSLHIDVNCVAPGAMATHMMDAVIDAGVGKAGTKEFELAEKLKAANDSTVQDHAAALCTYLACADSDGITGKLISAPWDPWQQFIDYKDVLSNSDIYTLRRIVPSDRGQSWDNRE